MPVVRKRSAMKEKISELARVLNARAAKIEREPAWEDEYDSLILGDGPRGTYTMDPAVSQVNNNVLVIAGTGGARPKAWSKPTCSTPSTRAWRCC